MGTSSSPDARRATACPARREVALRMGRRLVEMADRAKLSSAIASCLAYLGATSSACGRQRRHPARRILVWRVVVAGKFSGAQ